MKVFLVVLLCLFALGAEAATVRSRSGISVRVHPSAVTKLQCVVNYIERAGVRIKAMRGYGRGTVRHSKHPAGRALDINQYARGKTRPHISRAIAAGATRTCGVIGGESWHNRDDGHWNL